MLLLYCFLLTTLASTLLCSEQLCSKMCLGNFLFECSKIFAKKFGHLSINCCGSTVT